MKKAILAVSVLLLMVCAVLWGAARRSLSFTAGYYLVTENGAHLLIDGNSPIRLSDRAKNDALFDGLTSGDRIRVLHDGVAESYPAQTGAYGVWKISDGSIEDIPVAVLESLMDLGWSFAGIKRAEERLDDFSAAVSWANYSESALLWDRALNRGNVALSDAPHLPILRFDSADELAAFKADISGTFDTQHDYDEIPSFDTVTTEMDEAFFASNSLLLTYVWAGSCTWRYDISHVSAENGTMTVYVQRTDNYEVGDCAMAGWFITLAVPKKSVDGFNSFDAVLSAAAQ